MSWSIRSYLICIAGFEWSTLRSSNSHGKKDSHCCPYCSKVYTARCNLSRHIRDQHSVADPNSVVCPICGKDCRNRSNALTHLYRTHHITSKQLRTEAGVLFNAQAANNSSSSPANSAKLASVFQKDLEALTQNVDDQEPPVFSFDDTNNEENNFA